MADRNKFEEMLERLVNEDKAGAEELFHEIVVEKSRDIYEGLLESDLEDEIEETTDEEVDEATDEEVEEASDEEVEEEFDLDEFEVAEADPTDDLEAAVMGADDDEGDDMDMDMDMDDEGDDSDEDIEDRVVDLEDALDDLKAEFEKMMADGDDEGDDEGDMDMGDEEEEAEEESFEFESADEEVEEASDEEVEETADEEVEEAKSEAEQMREYVEKVSVSHSDSADNKSSVVAGKNDMGGTASNIASGSADEKGRTAPTSKEDNAGNINTPGAKAAKAGGKAPAAQTAEKGADAKPVVGG